MGVSSAQIAQADRLILNVKYVVRDRAYDVVESGKSLGKARDKQRVSIPLHALTCFKAALHTSAEVKKARDYWPDELPVNTEGVPHRTLVDGMNKLYGKFVSVLYGPCRVTLAGIGIAQFKAWLDNQKNNGKGHAQDAERKQNNAFRALRTIARDYIAPFAAVTQPFTTLFYRADFTEVAFRARMERH
jgi:hypothetical protein